MKEEFVAANPNIFNNDEALMRSHHRMIINSIYGAYGFYGANTLKYAIDNYSTEVHRTLAIKKVIFNEPATIVFWEDRTKTVVKCSENETFDKEKGLAMAIIKKMLGNKGNYFNQIKKYTE